MDRKKEPSGKVIKLSPKGKLTLKLRINPVNREGPADLWYFTHT